VESREEYEPEHESEYDHESEYESESESVPRGEIRIEVYGRDCGHESVRLNVSPDESVENLKRMVLLELPEMRRFRYADSELKDGNTLRYYGIQHGSVIHALESAFQNIDIIDGVFSSR
jgi:hypothetical protein